MLPSLKVEGKFIEHSLILSVVKLTQLLVNEKTNWLIATAGGNYSVDFISRLRAGGLDFSKNAKIILEICYVQNFFILELPCYCGIQIFQVMTRFF